ncbi:MAG TPA: hypothetical protein VL200_00095 [Lacunisphaera sp.]|jgi:NDP-sugar pyrophosphorylase family protein|nr:hypothetical protein [Lacunisphaera sp.]
MKAILICPGIRAAVSRLAESTPLVITPCLGETPLAYWLVHLAGRGATEVTVLASDRPAAVRELVGGGERWGLRVNVVAEPRELTPEQARSRHAGGPGWLPAPDDVAVADHLPGQPDLPLFTSYRAWFAAVRAWLAHAVTPDRVGVKQLQPGVHVGWRSRIARDVEVAGPCWIGEKVRIGAGVRLGPGAVIENGAVIGEGATIVRSVVGPETLVGASTEIADSLAFGDTLINWRDGSCLRVPDEFLLCPLRRPPAETAEWFRRLAQLLTGSPPPLMAADHANVPRA